MKTHFKKFIRLFSNKWLWLTVIVLLGAYFRFANVYNHFSLSNDAGGDMEYYQMAEGLSKNSALIDPLTGEITACRSIMYPAFIAAINAIRPESGMGNVRAAQAVLSVFAIIMVFFLGTLVHSRVCGLIAAFLFAVNPIMIERVSWFWIESFYYFIALGVAIWMLIWIQKPNIKNTVLFGLVIGISLMCRSSLFFLPFILIGVYYFRPKAFKHVKKTMWILLLFSYILLLPWVARNAYHFKEFIPFERNAAAEDIYVASLGEISDQLDEPILRIVKKEKSDRIYQEMLSASINNILERPGRYISSYFLRFSFIMGELKFLGILGESSVLFYFFFLWGVFAALKSRKSAPLVLLLIYFIGIHIFMAIRLRHMFTIIPLFCVFVALGIASFIQKIGLLWRKKLLIETEKVSSWRMARKWISMGSFSLLSLFYLFALFFIMRELWTYIIVKPAAFAKFAPISQVTNDAYKLETQQPLVHFVENYARVMADKNLSLTANGKLAKHSKKYKHYPLPTTLRLITNKMVLIPSGKFYMGSRFWVGKDDEHPRHEVYLDDFFIDKYETTAGEYIECVKAGKCEETRVKDGKCNYDRQERANHPANCVNWHQANAYCKWLGKRLPSEAEWEKAARGIDGRKYPWGDERVSCKYAIIDNSEDEENLSIWSLRRYPQSQIFKRSGCGRDITWFIGSKPKGVSPYGVMDMIGNVSEWVSDWYDENYYNESLNKNPNGSLSGKYRVARGCSWHDYTGSISAAFRFKYLPVYNNDDLGFRCAANVAAEPCSTMKEAKGKKSEANKEIK